MCMCGMYVSTRVWVHVYMEGCVCVCVLGIFLDHSVSFMEVDLSFEARLADQAGLPSQLLCASHLRLPGRWAVTLCMHLYGLLGFNSQICKQVLYPFVH